MSTTAMKTVDCRGLSCPMPVVRTKRAMDDIGEGQVLEVVATDRGAINDLQGWAKHAGHEIVAWNEEGGNLRFYIKKGN